MDGMPRPRPPHLQRERTRHGRVVWFVRIGKGPRTRIKHEYDSPEFWAAYTAAMNGEIPATASSSPAGSLAWLVERYREVDAWRSLSSATRRQRENIFKGVLASAGRCSYRDVTKATVVAGKDKRAATPSQARNFLDAMRGLFTWAVSTDLIRSNPTDGVKYPKRPKTEGFPIWTEDEAARYEQRWPIGTRQRVWFDVLLYTGLRRGDAVKLGRQHVRDGVATLRTEKSQGEIPVTIPILPVLQRTLDAGPIGELSFIAGARGQPMPKESFGNQFKDACRTAGVNKSAHGLRKLGATRCANQGATEAELEALFGWRRGSRMAAIYTADADRARLATGIAGKLAGNTRRTSAPAPSHKVRVGKRKPK